MGKMALGYGSEFHLLRWTGRHRLEFDLRVMEILKVDNITWLDFEFSGDKNSPDRELVGLSFLRNESIYNSILTEWNTEWPQSGNTMNWDLVGFTIKDEVKTWILIEAKAHIGELYQACGAISADSIKKIERALDTAASNNGIKILVNKSWTKKYYQLANRIYILDLLKRSHINAKLINIYFVGDKISTNRNSPQSERSWQPEIDKMKKYLNIEEKHEINVLDLYLEIDK